ncbi:MAG: hypothetical protein ACOYJB_04445 [Christensenellaceae bacterium]|jgi:hypothetical protein
MKKLSVTLLLLLCAFLAFGCSPGAETASPSAEASPAAEATATEDVSPSNSAEDTAAEAPEASADLSTLLLISVDQQVPAGQSEIYGLDRSPATISYTYSDSGAITEANDDVHTYFYEWDDAIWQNITDSIQANNVLNWNDSYGTQSDDYETFWMVSLVFDDGNGSTYMIDKKGTDEFPDEWPDFILA